MCYVHVSFVLFSLFVVGCIDVQSLVCFVAVSISTAATLWIDVLLPCYVTAVLSMLEVTVEETVTDAGSGSGAGTADEDVEM